MAVDNERRLIYAEDRAHAGTGRRIRPTSKHEQVYETCKRFAVEHDLVGAASQKERSVISILVGEMLSRNVDPQTRSALKCAIDAEDRG